MEASTVLVHSLVNLALRIDASTVLVHPLVNLALTIADSLVRPPSPTRPRSHLCFSVPCSLSFCSLSFCSLSFCSLFPVPYSLSFCHPERPRIGCHPERASSAGRTLRVEGPAFVLRPERRSLTRSESNGDLLLFFPTFTTKQGVPMSRFWDVGSHEPKPTGLVSGHDFKVCPERGSPYEPRRTGTCFCFSLPSPQNKGCPMSRFWDVGKYEPKPTGLVSGHDFKACPERSRRVPTTPHPFFKK
jgi:hypothetical protein